MNHYPRHIGDWRVATFNLTRVQRDIYSALIDTYYDREQPLPSDFDMLAEDHGCRGEEERAALVYVLKRYFHLEGGVYRHERCDEEIAHFKHIVDVAKRAGKASANKRSANAARADRKQSSNARSTSVEKGAKDHEKTGAGTNLSPSSENGDVSGKVLVSDEKSTDVERPLNDRATTVQPPKTEDPREPPLQPAVESGGAISSPPPPEPEQRFKPSKKCPKSFVVTARMAAWAGEKCPLLSVRDIERQTDTFRDHSFGNAITDWEGAWRNWLRKEQQYREARRTPVVNGKTEQRDSFMAAVKGDRNGHITRHRRAGALDVESRVVREDEESAPDPAD